MGYVQAALLLAVILFVIAVFLGAGVTIIMVGAAVGAATLVVFGLVAIVVSTWDWLASLGGRRR